MRCSLLHDKALYKFTLIYFTDTLPSHQHRFFLHRIQCPIWQQVIADKVHSGNNFQHKRLQIQQQVSKCNDHNIPILLVSVLFKQHNFPALFQVRQYSQKTSLNDNLLKLLYHHFHTRDTISIIQATPS